MAGIYIHIPFCRQACHYCDFHFSTNLKTQNKMIAAIAKEITDRKDYLRETIHTIYFGGGTPSLLEAEQLGYLLKTIQTNYSLGKDVEITLEANPEDLTLVKSNELFQIGVNRLSIGIQTFDESKLQWMNRAHNAKESVSAFEHARKAGFTNISLDLIYAIPDHDRSKWEMDLKSIAGLKPEHISLYGLTIEDQTVFGKWEQQNKLVQVPEDEAANQYLFAIAYLKSVGYLQYEVSNFGKEGFYSRHNNNYWSGIPYLGVGPGAHSFDGTSRRFNIRSNPGYLKGIQENSNYFETELLTEIQQVNERILTQLRTAKGLDLNQLKSEFGFQLEPTHSEFINEILLQELVEMKGDFLRLKPKGFLVADEIALRLFTSE